MYKQIAENKRRTVYLFVFFFIFILLIGWALSYLYNSPGIFYIAIVIAVIQSWISYFFSESITLAVSGANEAPREEYLDLHRIVENLSITAGLQKPKIYVIDDPAPNAFATGRDEKHASIAVTTGLLEIMDHKELEGVLAHELSHVGNRDILISTVAVTLVGVVTLVSDIFLRSWWWRGRDDRNRNDGGYLVLIGILLAILAPLFAKLIELAVSRKREYLADASGVLLTRYPEGLASALEKLEQYERPMRRINRATAHLYINEPYGQKEENQSWFMTIFSTHPPLSDRINKLREMLR